MARSRKNVGHGGDRNLIKSIECKGNGTSSSSSASDKSSTSPVRSPSLWKSVGGCTCLAIAVVIAYIGYLETRVNTPFDDHKIVKLSGLDIPERFWGSYRPGNYFGMKTRDPNSILMGLMWYSPDRLRPGGDGIRHWCSQSDGLGKYGWIRHDGETFGEQEIHDGLFKLSTSFVKVPGGTHGGDWTARISVEFDKTSPEYHPSYSVNETVSLIWYTTSEGIPGVELNPSQASNTITGLRGYSHSLGDFKLFLLPHKGKLLHQSYLSTISQGVHLLRETVISSLRLVRDSKTNNQFISLAGNLLSQVQSDKISQRPDFVATQVTFKVPFSIDVVYESGSFHDRDESFAGDLYTKKLEYSRENFDLRFEETFKLKEKGFNDSAFSFAQAAFSNLIGGIGYFYGSSKVQSKMTKDPVRYWKAPLYTSVPSRSHFPRGFLWDEGFHVLLIAQWDRKIALDIMAHWFDLMNVEGWIPREQILGAEALARVPEEFVTQRNTNANPPTFFLTLVQMFGENHGDFNTSSEEYQTLNRMFTRLQAWYNWFNKTQAGELPSSYRWRGRDPDSIVELNPKTLTSGLDDYPRASHPNPTERHVDLRCWMYIGAKIMGTIANVLEQSSLAEKYLSSAVSLEDPAPLHWSAYTETFSDYGLHTDGVALKPPPINPNTGARGVATSQGPRLIRSVSMPPEPRFVDSAFGYVSLFPLLLKILPPDCPRLNKLLHKLTDSKLLWTPYGLRSLSKSSPMYMKRNTEHDPPYWRGQIWINMNYLAVAALHHYSKVENSGENGPLAASIYKRLRKNVIDNVMKEYKRTGYLWEQYSDKTGEGSGCKPFTGWTSLVVLIMSEKY